MHNRRRQSGQFQSSREIERLQAQMAAMIKRQEEGAGQFEVGEQESPPPHY